MMISFSRTGSLVRPKTKEISQGGVSWSRQDFDHQQCARASKHYSRISRFTPNIFCAVKIPIGHQNIWGREWRHGEWKQNRLYVDRSTEDRATASQSEGSSSFCFDVIGTCSREKNKTVRGYMHLMRFMRNQRLACIINWNCVVKSA